MQFSGNCTQIFWEICCCFENEFVKWQFFLSFLFLNGNCLFTSSMKLLQVKREEKAEKGAGQEKVDPNL